MNTEYPGAGEARKAILTHSRLKRGEPSMALCSKEKGPSHQCPPHHIMGPMKKMLIKTNCDPFTTADYWLSLPQNFAFHKNLSISKQQCYTKLKGNIKHGKSLSNMEQVKKFQTTSKKLQPGAGRISCEKGL